VVGKHPDSRSGGEREEGTESGGSWTYGARHLGTKEGSPRGKGGVGGQLFYAKDFVQDVAQMKEDLKAAAASIAG
jgi:hypothetical protein